MTMRKLPSAAISARPGLRSEVAPSAFDRWNPEVRGADGDAETTITILDVIGADLWGEGVTAKRVAGALRQIGKKDVTVVINSPGGNYFEGLAIYNLLRDHKAKVSVKVVGVAASAAAVIAMAGDDIQIARAGFLMIHNTWVMAAGDRHAMREVADWLEPFDETAVDIFSARTGIEPKDIAKQLDRETWIGGKEAVEQGFADSLLASDEVETAAEASASSTKPVVAAHKIDSLLAKAGVSRSERRELLAAMKGGMPGAASSGMSGAAVVAEVESLLESIRSFRTA